MDYETVRVQYMINVLEHYKSGGVVQARPGSGAFDDWRDCRRPSWDWTTYDYRIKPLVPDSIDWDAVSPKFNYMARTANGRSLLFERKPTVVKGSGWRNTGGGVVGQASLFSSLAVGTVDWKDSLVARPGYDV